MLYQKGYKKVQEQGVFLLLDQRAQPFVEAQISRIHQTHKLKNTLHVSIYQFVSEKINSKKIEEKVAEVALAYNPIELSCASVGQKYKNVALTFARSNILAQLSKDIIESINPIRAHTLLEQVQHMDLNNAEKVLVDKYGVPWGVPPGKIHPHMTLQYNEIYKHPSHLANKLKTLTFSYVALGELGKSGNIISVQKCFKLGRRHA